jgi:hypothetical protein
MLPPVRARRELWKSFVDNGLTRYDEDRNRPDLKGKPDAVTCPDNLKGVEGATLRCQLTDGGEKYGISVTVTSVDAGDVNFDFKVDDHAQ